MAMETGGGGGGGGGVRCGVRDQGGDDVSDEGEEGGGKQGWLHGLPLVDVDVV